MATVEIWDNEKCLPTGEPLPFKPSRNFFRAVAECENHTGNAVKIMAGNTALIEIDSSRRFMVFM
ncbi:hypothetical protein [Vibrio metschnikovii]|uniref:hypothetical protein n=1 Tax=Vibrio metschnikovii TaxID=28172 RepID=UPI001C306C9B|nr:hypothetical protein [Vibrio metschnikovii]